MSDRVDSFSVPPSYDVDFDVPSYRTLACKGIYFAMAKIGIPFVVMVYVYLKYMDGQMASVPSGRLMPCTRAMVSSAVVFLKQYPRGLGGAIGT